MTTAEHYAHLGPFSDLVEVAARFAVRAGAGQPGPDSAAVRRLLGFDHDASPVDPRTEARWSREGVDGEEVSWSVGYGPRTRAWYLRPSGATGPLPGVLALHSHDAYKFFGREKIADGPGGMPPELAPLRQQMYQGRPFANDLARRGFAVLVPDVFLWGSRRFDLDVMPPPATPSSEGLSDGAEDPDDAGAIRWYNRLAARHEHVVAKYCTVLGTSLAGIVAYEDRVAAAYLASRADVQPRGLGCVGLSGGGCRAALLHATTDRIRAAVVVGMMSTHQALLDRHVANHTWMFFPPGLPGIGDWPDLTACRAPSLLMVQYLLDDALFPQAGMRGAHRRLTELYERTASAEAYTGEFYPGPHRFDMQMQDSAFTWLAQRLR